MKKDAGKKPAKKLQCERLNSDQRFCIQTTIAALFRQNATREDFKKEYITIGIYIWEDVSKVLEYLRKHCNEFNTGYCCKGNEIHTILDQNFFLDAFHKMKLKEEFDVQPWTLEQHLGEAIIVPAVCPYQIRKLKCKSFVHFNASFLDPSSQIGNYQTTKERRSQSSEEGLCCS